MDQLFDTHILRPTDLLDRGWSPGEVRSELRHGNLRRIRRGTYTDTPAEDPVRNATQRMAAAMALNDPGTALSHESAALLHGLPIRQETRATVRMTAADVGRRGRRPGIHLTDAHLPPEQLTEVGGLLATTPARTVVDLARGRHPGWAVAAGDAALRLELTDPGELAGVLSGMRRWPGVARARRLVSLLDAAAESPGESVSRHLIRQWGLPDPVLQQEFFDEHGVLRARVDFWWPQHGVIGEFDGLDKYGALPSAPDPRAVLIREKEREDWLRAQGWLVIRWIWRDLPSGEARHRLSQALRQRT